MERRAARVFWVSWVGFTRRRELGMSVVNKRRADLTVGVRGKQRKGLPERRTVCSFGRWVSLESSFWSEIWVK